MGPPPDAVGVFDALTVAWAYVGLAFTAFWGSELVPLLAGFASEQGHLAYVPMVLSVAAGAWVVATGLYFVGRWRASWVRLRARAAPPVVRGILRILRSNPWRSAVLARFVLGGRILLPLACGAARVPVWIFLTGTAFASVSWAVIYSAVGWFFGQSAVALVGHIRDVEEVIVGATIAAIALGLLLYGRRRQKRAAKAMPPAP